MNIGDHCTFVDSLGKHHAGLITAIHGFQATGPDGTLTEDDVRRHNANLTPEMIERTVAAYAGKPASPPSINVVFVSDDESQRDPYGRQIVRNTSVVHQSNQSAHGMYWF